MFVVLIYDVAEKSQSKVRIICEKYLYRVQKSAFEGYLTESQLELLKAELENKVIPESDSICIYKVPNYKNIQKDELGFSAVNNIEYL